MFLLAGPATNLASLTVLVGTLGKRATAIYLSSIAVCSVLFGLVVDQIYGSWGFSAQAIVGQASEIVPHWLQWTGALVVVLLSIKPIYRLITSRLARSAKKAPKSPELVTIQPKMEPPSGGPT